MIHVCIDESGNLGRGGKYFVLAAVVFDTDSGKKRASRVIKKAQKRIADEANQAIIEELKSSKMSFPQRQTILQKLVSKADIDLFYLAIDKTKSRLLSNGMPKNLAYNYFAGLLVEKIISKYNDSFDIVFDQRTTAVKSMNSLTDYLRIKAFTKIDLDKRTIEIVQRDSKTMRNLQTADLIAGTVYRAYNNQQLHFLNLIKARIVSADEFPRNSFDGSLISNI